MVLNHSYRVSKGFTHYRRARKHSKPEISVGGGRNLEEKERALISRAWDLLVLPISIYTTQSHGNT
jgi:hypothetical protein